MDIGQIGTGGISGILGIIIGYLGFKTKVTALEKNLEGKVNIVTCKTIEKGVDQRFDDMKELFNTKFDSLEAITLNTQKGVETIIKKL